MSTDPASVPPDLAAPPDLASSGAPQDLAPARPDLAVVTSVWWWYRADLAVGPDLARPHDECSNPRKPDGSACSDGNACTQSDSCQAGTCVGSNPVVCSASNQCHEAGSCNPVTGLCSNPPTANGTACSDGNACTQCDLCQAGVCVGSLPVVCQALDQCHDAGSCNSVTGICSKPPKGDGAACSIDNTFAQCHGGVCGS